MLRVGIAGVGFMSWIHYLAYQRVPGVQVVAFSSRDPRRRAGDWRGIQGNFGPPGEQIDMKGVTAYETLDEMLGNKAIDLIDVCLPPHLHVDACLWALEDRKHVFCEKPLALTAKKCSRIMRAARLAGGKQVLVGHVLPFFPEYAEARKVIASGKFGKLLGGHFKRVISDPLWLKDFFDPQRVGGPLIDLHVHDAHLIRLLFGRPKRVQCRARLRGELAEYFESCFEFADRNLLVTATSGVIKQQGRPFTHGFEIHLEKATLHYEFAAFTDGGETMPLKMLTNTGKVLRPKLGDGDPLLAFVAEIREVARCIHANEPSPILSAELARDAIRLCERQAESAVTGRPRLY